MKKLSNPVVAPMASLQDVDAALGKIFALKNSIDAVQRDMEKQVSTIKDKKQDECLILAGQIQSLEDAVIKFVEANREKIFIANKSLRLNFGIIGYRLSSRLVIKNAKSTVEKIRQFFRNRAKDAIIVKESPNKNVLAKWQPAELKKIGAKIESSNEFYYESVDPSLSTESA